MTISRTLADLPNFITSTSTGNINISSNTVSIDAVNDRVGINTASPSVMLDLSTSNIYSTTHKVRVTNYYPNSTSMPVVELVGARYDSNETFFGRFAAGYRRTDGNVLATGTRIGSLLFGGQAGSNSSFDEGNVAYAASIAGITEGPFTSTTSMPTGIIFKTGSSGYASSSYNNSFGSERMRITSDGKVGIGTSTPSNSLDVVSNGAGNSPFLTLKNTNGTASGSFGPGVILNNGLTGHGFIIQHRHVDNGPLTISNPASPYTTFLSVSQAGNVNIGSTISTPMAFATGAVTRTIQDKFKESISLLDFGAVADGTTDISTSLNNAINYLGAAGGEILIPAGVYKLSNTVTIQTPVTITGAGFNEGNIYGGTAINMSGSTILYNNVYSRGAVLKRLTIYQDHPTPTADPGSSNVTSAEHPVLRSTLYNSSTWAPTDHDYVIKVVDTLGGVELSDIQFLNVNKGVYCYNSGRLYCNRIKSQFFKEGFYIDNALDVCTVSNVHNWPFWSNSPDVTQFTQKNAKIIQIGKVDGIFMDNIFTYASNMLFHIFNGTGNGTSRGWVCTQAYADLTKYAVYIDADVNGSLGSINYLTAQCGQDDGTGNGIVGGRAVSINGIGNKLTIDNLLTERYWENAIEISSSAYANVLFMGSISTLWINQSNTNAPWAVVNGTSNILDINHTPQFSYSYTPTSNYGSSGSSAIALFPMFNEVKGGDSVFLRSGATTPNGQLTLTPFNGDGALVCSMKLVAPGSGSVMNFEAGTKPMLTLQIESGSNQTGMIVYCNIDGSLVTKRVKIGAANSGGSGYRALIIDN